MHFFKFVYLIAFLIAVLPVAKAKEKSAKVKTPSIACESLAKKKMTYNKMIDYFGAQNKGCIYKFLCGDFAYLDCNSAFDGPEFYIDLKLKRSHGCGESCLGEIDYCRKGCPPTGWNCKHGDGDKVVPKEEFQILCKLNKDYRQSELLKKYPAF